MTAGQSRARRGWNGNVKPGLPVWAAHLLLSLLGAATEQVLERAARLPGSFLHLLLHLLLRSRQLAS